MYIEIRDGLSINTDAIEAIEKGDNDLTCKVHTHLNTYLSNFPYLVMLQLVERQEEKKLPNQEIQKQMLNIQKEIGTFTG